MHKVMIVDDEPMIRQGLQTLIDWERHGFEIVGTAANGKEAVQKHGELRPDLILIDMRMPVMDGLQAIEQIRQTDDSCHILILSGYADFNYAKQAIVYGVGGYVVKPIDEDELESYVERASKSLGMQKEAGTGIGVRNIALLREELLQSLVDGKSPEAGMGEKEQRELFGSVAALANSRLLLAELYSREHSLTMKTVAKKKLTELIEGRELGWVFAAEPYIGMLLKNGAQLRGGMEPFREALEEACGSRIRYTAVVSQPLKALAELPAASSNAKSRLKRRFLLSGGCIYDAAAEASSGAERPESEPLSVEDMAQLLFYRVDLGNGNDVLQQVDEFAADLIRLGDSEQALKSNWAQLLTLLLNKAAAIHPQLSLKEDLYMVTRLYMAHHYGEMMDELKTRLLELTAKIGGADGSVTMKRVTDFIERHYSEPLRLETLAELFNYNSGYLGKLFKSHTGESFNTYLDKVRIEQAIKLLREGHKVHQVAERVGYANVDYFHGKFKKYKGVSPSSYKSGGSGI
ncbi:response regulator transcription factor [Paenibacillus sp. LHD-117]|uniref:response regulator transcription factor n=1 Tax=Paenibacillus sp. LHD-117 TaxID=3071412 RepID=UPI0027E1CEA0|nr:response regulator transcription factor [Paenibacillus sp. LHD-117]MDQ6422687.1 response regulator transcription factor [Paenibacillus sp. LHD-117]